MKRLFFQSLILMLLSVLLVLQGCSESTYSKEEAVDPPTFEMTNITLPQAMLESSNQYVQQAKQHVDLANSFSMFSYLINPPDRLLGTSMPVPANGPPWHYEWTVGSDDLDEYGDFDFTAELDVKESATANKYDFDLSILGIISFEFNGNTYHLNTQDPDPNNTTQFSFINGLISVDGESGGIDVNDTGGLFANIHWSKNVTNLYEVGLQVSPSPMIEDYIIDLSGGQSIAFPNGYVLKIQVDETDFSGSIEIIEIIDPITMPTRFTIVWDDQGHGDWTAYDTDGATLDAGTF